MSIFTDWKFYLIVAFFGMIIVKCHPILVGV